MSLTHSIVLFPTAFTWIIGLGIKCTLLFFIDRQTEEEAGRQTEYTHTHGRK